MAKTSIVGIALADTQVECTRVSLDGATVSGTERQGIPSAALFSHPLDWNELLAPFARTTGEIHIALPAEQTLLRVIELPTVDPTEIEGMVEIQMDQLAPFPTDLMLISWELLAQSDSRSRILMAGARQNLVDAIGDAAHLHGLGVHRLDSDIAAFYHILRKHKKVPGQGRHILMGRLRGVIWMLLVEDGSPLFIRNLGVMGEEPPEEFWQAAGEEMDYAMTEAEAEFGARNLSSVVFWYTGTPPDALHLLATHLGLPVAQELFSGMETLADAVAERALPGGPHRINLAPPAWRTEILSRGERRKLLTVALSLVAVWMLLVGTAMGVLALRRAHVNQLTKEAEALKGPAEEVVALQKELEYLSAFTNRSESVLECMREYNLHLPEGQDLVISDFLYSKEKGITLKGRGIQSRVYSYTEKLGESALFKISDIEYRSGRFTVNAHFPEAGEP